jgi:hypothetical protein
VALVGREGSYFGCLLEERSPERLLRPLKVVEASGGLGSTPGWRWNASDRLRPWRWVW